MSQSFEELKRKQVELQKKQLTAQRVAAAAAVVNAAAASRQAETLEAMRSDLNVATEATVDHQREMEKHQRLMAEDQRTTNFRNTVLATLPLLKENERTQYLTEQLLPRIKQSAKADVYFESLSLSDMLEESGFAQFVFSYAQKSAKIKEFLVAGNVLARERMRMQAIQAEFAAVQAELTTVENDERKEFEAKTIGFAFLSFIVAICTFAFILGLTAAILTTVFKTSLKSDNTGFVFGFIFVVSIITGIGATMFSYKWIKRHFNSKSATKLTEHQNQNENRLLFLRNQLGDKQREIELLSCVEKNVKKHDEVGKNLTAGLVDGYLASKSGQEFLGERAEQNTLLTVSRPWQEAVTEEQGFLPPSARLPFVEYWLPLLIEADDFLERTVCILRVFKQRAMLKTYLMELIIPDYDDQRIGLNSEVLSKPFFEALSILAPADPQYPADLQ